MFKNALSFIMILFMLSACKTGDVSILDQGEKSVSSTSCPDKSNKTTVK